MSFTYLLEEFFYTHLVKRSSIRFSEMLNNPLSGNGRAGEEK